MRRYPYPPSLTAFVVQGPYVFTAVATGTTLYTITATASRPYITGIRPQLLLFAATILVGIITARPLLAALQRAEAAAPFTISTSLKRVKAYYHTTASAVITFLVLIVYGSVAAASWSAITVIVPTSIAVPALLVAVFSALVTTEALVLYHAGVEPNAS